MVNLLLTKFGLNLIKSFLYVYRNNPFTKATRLLNLHSNKGVGFVKVLVSNILKKRRNRWNATIPGLLFIDLKINMKISDKLGHSPWLMEKEAMKYNMNARKVTLNMDYRFREDLKVSAALKLICQKFLSTSERR